MKKIITWIDLEGRYRITSPAYDDLFRLSGFDEDEAIAWVWSKLVASGKYGIGLDHPRFLVEDDAQRERVLESEGTYFRYNVNGIGGAWEMDIDGRPKVDMPKARGIHMDHIRKDRDIALILLDVPSLKAIEKGNVPEQQQITALKQVLRDIPQTFDLAPFTTPKTLKEAWPAELIKP